MAKKIINKDVEIKYDILIRAEDRDRTFTEEEKMYLKPIAEVCAMLDGNAFFGLNNTLWESYIHEAWAIFSDNGGINGWAGGASWIKDFRNSSPAVKEAYINYMTLKSLCKDDHEND